MAKNIQYAGKSDHTPVDGKIPFDEKVWQLNDTGDFINTLTGEIREPDQFVRPTESGGEDGSTGGWDDASQDSMGDDFVSAQVKTSGGQSKK